MFFPPPPNTQDDKFSKRALNYCEAALDNSDFLSIKPKRRLCSLKPRHHGCILKIDRCCLDL